MVYTQEEKEKMDIVLQAFQSYVDQREDYEVIYSRKAGYLRLLVGDRCDAIYFPITGFADMIRMFTDDFLTDEEIRAEHYLKRDYDHVHNLLAPRLDALGKLREEACEIVSEVFEACRTRSENMYQAHLEEIRRLEDLLRELRAAVI